MTDDQGYGDIAAHGNPWVKTPAMDLLHEQSVRLTNFHVDPCCAPSRSALLTGQHSSRSGVWHTIGGRSLLGTNNVTMAEVLRDNGYRTGVFGKWHLGENYPFRPMDRGFEESVIHGGGGVGANPDYPKNNYFDDIYLHNGVPEQYQGYCNTVWFEEAWRFINENEDQPFFCFVSSNVPHAPLLVDSSYIEPYMDLVPDRLPAFYGMITKLDEDLGVFLNRLDAAGLRDNTLLIFMTDNGPCPWFGGIIIDEQGFPLDGYSAGMRGGKIWGYENGHRVPCYISWPAGGVGGGLDINQLTAHIDLLPSMIEWCQLEVDIDPAFDGISLKSLIDHPTGDYPDRTLFIHNQRVDFPVAFKDYQVLSERWRLVKRDTLELYDIDQDPEQKFDVAADHPDVVQKMFVDYENWWNDIYRDMQGFNPIVLGTKHQNPSTLYSHDAHRAKGEANYWVVHFEEAGKYKFKVAMSGSDRLPEGGLARLERVPAVKGPDKSGSSLSSEMTMVVGSTMYNWSGKVEDGLPIFMLDIIEGETQVAASIEKEGKVRNAYAIEVTKL